jgi:hypothetical protein
MVTTAEAPVIVAESADFSTNANQTTIENLPINGRRWSFFALSTPGAVPDGGFGLATQMYTISGANLVFNPHFGVPTNSSNTLIAQRQIQVGIRLEF